MLMRGLPMMPVQKTKVISKFKVANREGINISHE